MKALLLILSAAVVESLPTNHGDASKPEGGYPILDLANITRAEVTGIGRRSLSGPFLGIAFPDPSIIWGDASWKAYGTSSNGMKVPVATASDPSSWTLTGRDALPDPGTWVGDGAIWAPDVQKNDNGVYVMYYTAPQKGGSHCIGVATSTTALGPFTPKSTPLICDTAGGGAIDASGYDDGKDRWIVWKVDGNNLGGATTCHAGGPTGSAYMPTPIKIQRLARDAMTLLDSPKTILDNLGAADDGVTEAPALYKIANGNYVLFFSTHCYSSDSYDIQYAFSNTIDGSYGNRGTLLKTSDGRGIWGPGGLDLDPNGSTVLFHGRLAAGQGDSGKRELFSGALSINGRSVSI